MSFVYTDAKRGLLEGEYDLADDDIRLLIVMTNTTADTEEDAVFVGDLATLDEMDGSGYSRVALSNPAVSADDANDRANFTVDATVFPLVGAGTRSMAGVVVYKHTGDDATSPLIAFYDDGFPFAATGANVSIAWTNSQALRQA